MTWMCCTQTQIKIKVGYDIEWSDTYMYQIQMWIYKFAYKEETGLECAERNIYKARYFDVIK